MIMKGIAELKILPNPYTPALKKSLDLKKFKIYLLFNHFK
jgi:hypothetical protein